MYTTGQSYVDPKKDKGCSNRASLSFYLIFTEGGLLISSSSVCQKKQQT